MGKIGWHWVACAVWMGACSPQPGGESCPADTGAFAFRSIAGGPIRKPGEARPESEEIKLGDDHDDGPEAQDGPWLPGEPEFGAVTVHDRSDPGKRIIRRDAWRPARTPTLAAWSPDLRPPMDDETPRTWLTTADCAALAPREGPILWWRTDGGEWLDAAAWLTRCRETSFDRIPVARCVDEACLLGDPSGGLVILQQRGQTFAILGVAEGWRGDSATIKAFSRALAVARVATYDSELGEVLSIEDAGRAADVEARLVALAKANPDHYFLSYFAARNLAGQSKSAASLTLLAQLAANPAPEAVAARALAGLHEEWAHLRETARYQAIQSELQLRIPDDVTLALAWLIRFRRSIPHLNAAILDDSLNWLELREVIQIATLYPATWTGLTAEVVTPSGTHLIEFDHDRNGLAGVRRVVFAPRAASPPAPNPPQR